MARRLLPHALVVLAGLLACWPSLRGSFVYDDEYYVVGNPAVSGTASPWTTPLGAPEQALWRPLTVATFRAQWAGSDDAQPFRAVNLGLHLLTALLLLELALAIHLGAGASLAAALLFVVHPVHAEAVAWVSGRAELLAAVLLLGAWRAHLSARRGSALLSALLLCGALLSKESAALAPLLFLLLDIALRRRPLAWQRLALLGSVVLLTWAARFMVLPQVLPGETPFGELPPVQRLLVTANIFGRALSLMLWPEPLRVFYPRGEFLAPDMWWLAIAAAWLAGVLVLWRRQRLTAMLLLCVPASMLAVLNLLPIGATFAERFLYLPSALFCLAAGALIAARGRRELTRPAGSALGLGLSIAVPLLAIGVAIPTCRHAMSVFRDDLSLWAHAATVAPNAAHIRYNHGYFLEAAGSVLALDRDHPAAADELAASLQLEPGHLYAGLAHQLLGNLALSGAGRLMPEPALAARHYREALGRTPGLIDARLNLASIAAHAPLVVSREEALAALAVLFAPASATAPPVTAVPPIHLTPTQQQLAEELRAQLLAPTPEAAPKQASADDAPPPDGP